VLRKSAEVHVHVRMPLAYGEELECPTRVISIKREKRTGLNKYSPELISGEESKNPRQRRETKTPKDSPERMGGMADTYRQSRSDAFQELLEACSTVAKIESYRAAIKRKKAGDVDNSPVREDLEISGDQLEDVEILGSRSCPVVPRQKGSAHVPDLDLNAHAANV